MPLDVIEAWSLSKEFLLCEAERALIKLLLDIQKCDSKTNTSNEASPGAPFSGIPAPVPHCSHKNPCSKFQSQEERLA